MTELLLEILKHYGLKEYFGKEHNPEIVKMFHEIGYNWVNDDETAWCLSGDIEVLTSNGFVRLDSDLLNNYNGDIAQLNTETHIVEWVKPLKWIVKDYKGEIYEINKSSISLACDPDHQFYGKWTSGNRYYKRSIKEITLTGIAIPIIISGQEGFDISDHDLILLAAYLSDGSKRYNRINFKVSKRHKINELNKLNYIWSHEDYKVYGNKNRTTIYSFKLPDVFKHILDKDKTLKWSFVSSLSQKQCKLFTDTYSLFDGTVRFNTKTIFTSDKELAESLCYISTMAGYKTTPFETKMVSKNCKIDKLYNVYISNNKHKYICKNNIVKKQFDGKLYCVTVPSGVFIIRDRIGNILPVGNCSAALNYFCKKLGYKRSGKLDARSWLKVGKVVKVPETGDIVVLWRDNINSWQGHVGLYISEDKSTDRIYVLGGNQDNMISIKPYHKSRVLGYRKIEKI